jgi:hypothetical protein
MFEETLYVKLFCQTTYQNGSSSTDKVIYGAETKKNSFNGEMEPCQTGTYILQNP